MNRSSIIPVLIGSHAVNNATLHLILSVLILKYLDILALNLRNKQAIENRII